MRLCAVVQNAAFLWATFDIRLPCVARWRQLADLNGCSAGNYRQEFADLQPFLHVLAHWIDIT